MAVSSSRGDPPPVRRGPDVAAALEEADRADDAVVLAGRSGRGRIGVTPTALAGLAGGLAGALLFLVAFRGLPDDSYITLGYARNLVEHGHWGLTAFRDANSATSPLNVWLLATGILVTGRPVVAVGLVLVLATAALGSWSAGLAGAVGRPRPALVFLVVALVVTSPIFASVVGMESFLGAALLVGVARYASAGRVVAAGGVTGLAVLCRPDLAVPTVVVLAVLLLAPAPRTWRPMAQALAVALAVALPWHLFSWFALGGLVPDTLVIKTSGSFPGGEEFGNGPLFYLQRWFVPTLLVGAVVLVGLVALAAALAATVRGRAGPVDRAVVALGLAGLAHYAVYAAMGVSSYIWYYSPSVSALTVCAALGAVDLGQRRIGGAVVGLAVVAGLAAGLQIAGGVPWSFPVLFGNWATSAQYLDAGRGLRAALPPGQSVQAPGEIGALAYGCECDIVDEFSDHDRVVALAQRRAATAGPWTRALLRVNYLFSDRDAPRPTERLLRWEAGPDGPGWPTDVPGRGRGRVVLEPAGAP